MMVSGLSSSIPGISLLDNFDISTRCPQTDDLPATTGNVTGCWTMTSKVEAFGRSHDMSLVAQEESPKSGLDRVHASLA